MTPADGQNMAERQGADILAQVREALRESRRTAEEYGGLLGNSKQGRAIEALAALDGCVVIRPNPNGRVKNMWTAEPPVERFWSMVNTESAECWLWTGSKSKNGYGRFSVYGKRVYAHRFAWETSVGLLPDWITLDHLCRTRHCVRPEHLEPVDWNENVMRGEGLPAKNYRKTHCDHGHEFTEENTYRSRQGHRSCRECTRIRQRERYARDATYRARQDAHRG